MMLFGMGCDIAREANVESTKSLCDAPFRWLTSLVLFELNIGSWEALQVRVYL